MTDTYTKVRNKYNKLFKLLYISAFYGYKRYPLPLKLPKFCHILHDKVINCESPQNQRIILSKDDIKQQLEIIWLRAIDNYFLNRPSVSLKQYLIRISIFRLRDYIKKELIICSYDFRKENSLKENYLNFELDLNFVCLGNQQEPWNILYPYERYLLYLMYTKELSTINIGKKLNKDKHTIQKMHKNILLKLKENFFFDAIAA